MTAKNNGPKGRQNWATPWPFFNWLNETFGPFTLDVCAEAWSAKCPKHYTVKENGLIQNWPKDAGKGKFFCNPEFADPDDWLEKGYRHARYDGASGLYVLPLSTDTSWFHDFAALGDIILLRGRINFQPPPDYRPSVDPKTNKLKKTGNNTGTLLVIYDPEEIQLPKATKAGALSLTAMSYTPFSRAQITEQGAQLPLIGA